MTIGELWRRMRVMIGRRQFDRELREEIQLHIELRAERLHQAGLSREDATYAAHRRFGNATRLTDESRDLWTFRWVEALGQDVRYACRAMRKNLAFALTAVLTLSLGIGANTVIFSVVDTAILRPLSYRDADRLVVVHEIPGFFGLNRVNGMHFGMWRTMTRSFEQMALLGGMAMNLTSSGEPERIQAARVSPSLFFMLGIRAQLGRTFVDADDQPGNDRVVVLGDQLWRRHFEADPQVIGRSIELDGQAYEVVGVLPSSFHFPTLASLYPMTIDEGRPEIWKPMALRPDELKSGGRYEFACIARLKPGVALAQASADINVAQSQVARLAPQRLDLRAAVVPLQDQIVARARSGLELLLAAVVAVLVIGCVNTTNLLLARNAVRRRETALRRAIGASRGRLVWQMVVESLVLSGLGGAVGVALAFAALQVILASAPADVPRVDEMRLDGRVLLFTLLVSSVTGIIVGVLPAWRFATVDLQEAMKSVARTSTASRGARRLRSLLVSLEVGLSAMCLIAGGLLLHSFAKLMSVEKGFDSARLVTVDVNLPDYRYSNVQKKAAFVHALLERVASLPGVAAVGVSNKLPLTGEGGGSFLRAEGRTVPGLAYYRVVNPDYFRTMAIPLQHGRIFTETDRDRPVALVSVLTAERLWPGQNAIGQRFRAGPETSPLNEVIGVVSDVRGVSLMNKVSPTVYLPYWQNFYGQASLVVKITTDPASSALAIREAIRAIDAELPASAFRTMDETVLESVAQQRFQMQLVLLFGVAAMVLASLGVYGVVSYAVAQRTTEIGIRRALGAPATSIRRIFTPSPARHRRAAPGP